MLALLVFCPRGPPCEAVSFVHFLTSDDDECSCRTMEPKVKTVHPNSRE